MRQSILGANKKTIEEYLDELVNWDEATREEAAKMLGEIGDELAIEPLLIAVKEDESEDVRVAAAYSLAYFDDNPNIAPRIGEIFPQESSPIVKFALADTLGELGDGEAAKKMIPTLDREEIIWLREAIIEALGKIPMKEFAEVFINYLSSDAAEEVRIQSAKALLKHHQDCHLETFLELFKKEKSDIVKSHIIEIIAELPDLKSIETLSEALDDDENTLTKAAAAEALHKIALALGYSDENEMMDSL